MKISAKKLNEKHLTGVGNSFYGEMMQLAENLEIENEKLRHALRMASEEPNIDKARAIADAILIR